ncbi:hypothetical protein LTR64_004872 [Lithohypha guttulata]|uniref:uncharacterized protein n=1 Tax=Lithohypha guttulata TaxID=1690604 RepID=UPI002DDDF2EF|nr:hypothetical protein LTR51_005292 [Lithohypha guttulata]
MPLYNVEHSYPLKGEQKAELAERITRLHSRTFTTPSIFVQVKFYSHDASAHNYFVAGKPKEECANRIIGFVRTSASRTKEQFDKLAEQIEDSWYIVVGQRVEGQTEDDKPQKDMPEKERKAMEIMSVTFIGGYMGREKGFPIPEAGDEGEWMKANRKQFERRAELGEEDIKDMLQEVDEREGLLLLTRVSDLKSWRA